MNKLQALLDEHGACEEAREWAKKFRTPAQAWDACRNILWLLWAVSMLGLWRDEEKWERWCRYINGHDKYRPRDCDKLRAIFGNPFRKPRKKATVSARSP